MVLGPAPVGGDPLQVSPRVRAQRAAALAQLLFGEQARLDPLGQLDFLLGVEQRHLADLLEIVLDRVGCRARHRNLSGGEVLVVVAVDERLVFVLFPGGLGRLALRVSWHRLPRALSRAGGRPILGVVTAIPGSTVGELLIGLVSLQLDDHIVGVIFDQLGQVGVDIKLDVGYEIRFHVQVDLDVYSIPCRIDEVTVDRRPSSVVILLNVGGRPARRRARFPRTPAVLPGLPVRPGVVAGTGRGRRGPPGPRRTRVLGPRSRAVALTLGLRIFCNQRDGRVGPLAGRLGASARSGLLCLDSRVLARPRLPPRCGACRACHRGHPFLRWLTGRATIDSWLTGLAGDTDTSPAYL